MSADAAPVAWNPKELVEVKIILEYDLEFPYTDVTFAHPGCELGAGRDRLGWGYVDLAALADRGAERCCAVCLKDLNRSLR